MRTTLNSALRVYLTLALSMSMTSLISAMVDTELQPTVDSIKQLIAEATEDSVRYELYRGLTREITQVDRAAAIPYYFEQLEVAQRTNDPYKIGITFHRIGSQYLYLGKTDSAQLYEDQAYQIFLEEDDLKSQNDALNNLALIYQRDNKYEEAIETYQQVITYSDSLGDYVGSVYSYINLMSLFMDLDDNQRALDYVSKIEDIADSFSEMPSRDVDEIKGLFSAVYLNAGLCYTSLSILDSANYFYDKALKSLEDVQDDYARTYYQAYLNNSLGDNFYALSELNADPERRTSFPREALRHYTISNESFTDINENRGKTITLNNLGKTLNKLGEYEEAQKSLRAALELAEEIDFKEQVRDSYKYLADNAGEFGNYQLANAYLKEWVTYRDTIRNEERDKVTSELEVKFETAQKQTAIAELELENTIKTREQTIQKYIYWISILLFLGLASLVFSRYRLNKQKEVTNYEREMNQAMSRFVPMGFIKALGKEKITDVQLGDQVEKDVTVLFTDIRNYTSISEGLTPNANFAFIKEYAERMGPIIEKHNGFISQYLGDGIMAIFQNKSGARDALNACIDMQNNIEEFGNILTQKGRNPIVVGMGMHTGPLVMGIIGDEMRWDATLISDTVNTASRIENKTKDFGSSILLSQDSYQSINVVNSYSIREMGEVSVKGKKNKVKIYECQIPKTHEKMVDAALA